MSYSPIDKPTDFFNSVLYTGNGSTQSITGVGFQPDWVWYKSRSDAYNHGLFDIVRGVDKFLSSNLASAESTISGIASFNSDGFTVGSDAGSNGSSKTFVGWSWKAGTSFTNDASSTGIGTIDSTGSASDTAGFSIVSYSGIGGAGTIKHGLSTAPSMIIVKVRTGRTSDWLVYHKGIASDAQTDFLKLNEADAVADESTIWNDQAPTSSVFSVGTEDTVSGSGNTFVAYCFAQKKGYSKFSSYTGNGNADGTFVYTGFKPAFVMVKGVTSGPYWTIIDNKRTSSGFNPIDKWLYPNGSDAELNASSYPNDFLSNGFKIRTTGSYFNSSGVSYIYMAFAESPFVGSNFVPNNAE